MYRFATVPYTNAAPLVHFIPAVDPGARIVRRAPSELSALLMSDLVDAAIIPVVDWVDNPLVEMVDGLGIAADGDVESVLLRRRRPVAEIESLGLDPASKSSNALARILLRERFGAPAQVQHPGERADATVVIGDRALCASRGVRSYDLAGEWKAMTGMPFVFAVWACRAGRADRSRLAGILQEARRAGCDAIPHLARLHARRLGLSETRVRRYLTCSIRYDVGERERAAMALFSTLQKSLETTATHEHRALPAPVMGGAAG